MKFRQDIRQITRYYKKLVSKTKSKEIIGSRMVSWWYYIIGEQEKYIKNDYNAENTRHIKEKRKRELYQLIYNCLNESGFKLDFAALFKVK